MQPSVQWGYLGANLDSRGVGISAGSTVTAERGKDQLQNARDGLENRNWSQ